VNEDLLADFRNLEHAPSWWDVVRAARHVADRTQGSTPPTQIYAFGRFSLVIDGTPLCFIHKTPKKPIALLKVLIALGGRDVPGRQLTDTLWPDDEGDAAHDVLAVNLHRLRRLLGHHDSVTLHDGRLSLDPRHCWVDVWAFQRLLGKAADASAADRPSLLEGALTLYRGAFLTCESEEPWSLSLRERLRSAFVRHSSQLGRLQEEAGQWEEAIQCYQRGIEGEALAEELYRSLMRCYAHLGRRGEGVCVYRRLRQTLSLILGIAASPATEKVLRELLS
jgi:DNA-binding SARP family transcriptional activator